MSVDQKRSQHFGAFIESRTQGRTLMVKGGKRTTQPSEEPQNRLEAPEGESRVDLGEEDMDPETLKNLISTM